MQSELSLHCLLKHFQLNVLDSNGKFHEGPTGNQAHENTEFSTL